VAQGGLPFRAAWGIQHEGEALLADDSAPPGSEMNGGYPEMTMALLQRLGWADELTPEEMATIRQVAMNTLAAHQQSQGPATPAAGKQPGESNTLVPPEPDRSVSGVGSQVQPPGAGGAKEPGQSN